MLERVPHVKATPKPERCVRPAPAADAGRPTVHRDGWQRVGARAPDRAGHASRAAVTPASPGAWRVRPRRALGRHAPSPRRPLTGSGLVHRPPTGTPDHQQALSPASTAGRPRMRPSPPTSRNSTTRGEPRRPPRRRWPPRGPPRRLPSGTAPRARLGDRRGRIGSDGLGRPGRPRRDPRAAVAGSAMAAAPSTPAC